jgi:hypothetical protein
MKKKRLLIIIAVIVGVFILTNVYFTFFYTFQGRVIDADTREPIEGAVVVASWIESAPAPGGELSRLNDVKETLTDKNGKWSIRGARGRKGNTITVLISLVTFIPYTEHPRFIVFKPGYCSWPKGYYIEACKKKIRPDSIGDGETTELPKLTSRGDRLDASHVSPSFMTDILADKKKAKKIKEFIRLLNDEKRNLGLPELPILKELENEK